LIDTAVGWGCVSIISWSGTAAVVTAQNYILFYCQMTDVILTDLKHYFIALGLSEP